MTNIPTFDLPLQWSQSGKRETIKTIKNNCDFLELIINNAACFSDWWTKARIIQLAYEKPPDQVKHINRSAYAGCVSEQQILERLKAELECQCNSQEYQDFYRKVNDEFIKKTLDSWRDEEFTQAVGRNFEVYADRKHNNVFLVTSTAFTSLVADRVLPNKCHPDRFRPLFNIDELARLIYEKHDQNFKSLTLRTHGFSNPAKNFYKSFIAEADELYPPNKENSQNLYIGYHWPSEQPFKTPSLYTDTWKNLEISFKFLLTLIGLSLLAGLIYLVVQRFGAFQQNWVLSYLRSFRIVFVFWLLTFFLLRVIVYLRDRYRAIHYGVPDLAEFFWRLDRALESEPLTSRMLRLKDQIADQLLVEIEKSRTNQDDLKPKEFYTKLGELYEKILCLYDESSSSQKLEEIANQVKQTGIELKPLLLKVNLVGHSMGALLLVNMLRVLSDRFGKDDLGSLQPDFRWEDGEGYRENDQQPPEARRFGEHLELIRLILVSPDIPLELLQEGRNNYVRSAMSRCSQVFLMSSDRDIVLRYLSNLINWFNEPSLEMAGMRLGNVYLKKIPSNRKAYELYIRILLCLKPAVKQNSFPQLFHQFNYLDCSRMVVKGSKGGLNAVGYNLNPYNGIIIDLVNSVTYLLQTWTNIDLHGGYFQVNTPSFQVLKILINTDPDQPKLEMHREIKRILKNTGIRYWPSQQ